MSIHLEDKDLFNIQQMEVAVNGPDGATHLVLCTGVANLACTGHNTYTFLVGPQLSRRQFVGVIASGALSRIHASGNNPIGQTMDMDVGVDLVSIDADFNDESGHVKVRAEIETGFEMTKLAISYHVNILAELPLD